MDRERRAEGTRPESLTAAFVAERASEQGPRRRPHRTAMKKAPCGDTLVVSRKTSTEEARFICCMLDWI